MNQTIEIKSNEFMKSIKTRFKSDQNTFIQFNQNNQWMNQIKYNQYVAIHNNYSFFPDYAVSKQNIKYKPNESRIENEIERLSLS